MCRKSERSGSYGAISGAAMAMAMIANATTPQNADSGARRAAREKPKRRQNAIRPGSGHVDWSRQFAELGHGDAH